MRYNIYFVNYSDDADRTAEPTVLRYQNCQYHPSSGYQSNTATDYSPSEKTIAKLRTYQQSFGNHFVIVQPASKGKKYVFTNALNYQKPGDIPAFLPPTGVAPIIINEHSIRQLGPGRKKPKALANHHLGTTIIRWHQAGLYPELKLPCHLSFDPYSGLFYLRQQHSFKNLFKATAPFGLLRPNPAGNWEFVSHKDRSYQPSKIHPASPPKRSKATAKTVLRALPNLGNTSAPIDIKQPKDKKHAHNPVTLLGTPDSSPSFRRLSDISNGSCVSPDTRATKAHKNPLAEEIDHNGTTAQMLAYRF